MEFGDENTFSGRLHCEAYLASLLDNFTQHSEIDNLNTHVDKQTLQEMKVDHPPIFLLPDSHFVHPGLWTNNWSV